MPEHAAVDTSIFNELIPQALQQTLYTKKKKKISNVQKAKRFISQFATHKYIYLGGLGNPRATVGMVSIPC